MVWKNWWFFGHKCGRFCHDIERGFLSLLPQCVLCLRHSLVLSLLQPPLLTWCLASSHVGKEIC